MNSNGIEIKPEDILPEDVVILCQINPAAAMQLTNIILSRKLKAAEEIIEELSSEKGPE